jgi:hypothetical protein
LQSYLSAFSLLSCRRCYIYYRSLVTHVLSRLPCFPFSCCCYLSLTVVICCLVLAVLHILSQCSTWLSSHGFVSFHNCPTMDILSRLLAYCKLPRSLILAILPELSWPLLSCLFVRTDPWWWCACGRHSVSPVLILALSLSCLPGPFVAYSVLGGLVMTVFSWLSCHA